LPISEDVESHDNAKLNQLQMIDLTSNRSVFKPNSNIQKIDELEEEKVAV